MPQLDSRALEKIIQQIHDTLPLRIARPYSWVEDGAYDDCEYYTRLFIHEGFGYYIVSKSWIESPTHNHLLDEWMRAPWGTYPDLPPKPPKK